jgi:hypothetical protein
MGLVGIGRPEAEEEGAVAQPVPSGEDNFSHSELEICGDAANVFQKPSPFFASPRIHTERHDLYNGDRGVRQNT